MLTKEQFNQINVLSNQPIAHAVGEIKKFYDGKLCDLAWLMAKAKEKYNGQA